MKVPALCAGAVLLTTLLGGCVVAPVEPVPVYAAPPPPAAVVVRPAPRYYHHHRHHGRYRYWH